MIFLLLELAKHGESTKQNNNDLELNEKQRELNKEIDECNNKEERQRLKNRKNEITRKKQKILKDLKEKHLENLMEEIENSKEDSHRMFKALNIIQGKFKKENIVIKRDDKVVNNTNEKIKEISKHFKRCFQKEKK